MVKQRDIARRELEKRLRAMGWIPDAYDLRKGGKGAHIPLANYASNRAKLAAVEAEEKRQEAGR